MLNIVRTNSENPDFVRLVKLLDADLAKRDGEEHEFYSQFNKLSLIKHSIVLYENDQAIACGAMKEFDSKNMEVKRMYTIPEFRGKGIATQILIALESWATELSYSRCVLETGKRQPEAIALYKKNGYQEIQNYGQYFGIENSVCFEKRFDKKS